MVDLLLQLGAAVDQEAGFEKDTSLLRACRGESGIAVELLLRHGAHAFQKSSMMPQGDILCPVEVCLREKATGGLRLLHENKVDLETEYIPGTTPLLFCIRESNVQMIAFLLDELHCDVEATRKPYSFDTFPLMEAVKLGYLDAARVLLEKGASVNRATRHGMSPLALAALEVRTNSFPLFIDQRSEAEPAINGCVLCFTG